MIYFLCNYDSEIWYTWINPLVFRRKQRRIFCNKFSAIPLFCATLYLSQLSNKRYFTTLASHPIPPPEEAWTYCGIDIVCDLLSNSKIFCHLLGVDCYLTKYVAARALKNMTAREVLNKLHDIYLTLGFPKVVKSDQGPELRAN